MAAAVNDYRKLSIDERIQLVQDIWDSIVEDGAPLELSEDDKAELVRRVEAYRADPSIGIPWEEIRDELSNAS